MGGGPRNQRVPLSTRASVGRQGGPLHGCHAGPRPDRIRIDRTHIVGSIDPVNPVYIYKVEQIHAVDGIADGDSHQPRSALGERPNPAPFRPRGCRFRALPRPHCRARLRGHSGQGNNDSAENRDKRRGRQAPFGAAAALPARAPGRAAPARDRPGAPGLGPPEYRDEVRRRLNRRA